MDKKTIFLSIGIADLLLTYVLFIPQQYLSAASMFAMALIAVSGFLLIMLSNYKEAYENHEIYLFLKGLSVLSVILVICVAYYDLEYPASSPSSVYDFVVPVSAALILAFSLYQAKKRIKIGQGYSSYLPIIAVLALLSLLLFAMQGYRIYATHWNSTDELAYNYYAASLLIHGENPYSSSMAPILVLHSLYPTLGLDGTCECSYDYPALSFLLLAPIAYLSYQDFIYFTILATMALVVCVSFFIYRKSENPYSIIPIALWFAAFIYLVPAPIDKYAAVSLFLMLAYVYRRRLLLSGVLLGLAASSNQISWIALPFFFVFALKEHGKLPALKSFAVAAAIFLIINSYFLYASPHDTSNNLLSLFLARLQFSGASVTQLLLISYPVPYWFSTFLILAVLIASLLLFYLYTDTLRLFVAVVPLLVFFLSWRNLPSYSTAFIPLLIAVYYLGKDDNIKDRLHNKRLILYSLAILAVVCAASMLYAHSLYVNSENFKVTQISLSVGLNNTGSYELTGLNVNVSSKIDRQQNLSFYVVSIDPDNTGAYGSEAILPAYGYHDYMLNIAENLSKGTRIYIFTMSHDYISGITISAKG